MHVYRIYTEDTNRDAIETIMDARFQSYTFIPCKGVWLGAMEDSLIIEIVESVDRWSDVTDCAEMIRSINNQDAVMVTHTNLDRSLILAR